LISLIVVVDEPKGAYHGGDVAAPIFKRIVEQILRYWSVAPDLPEYSPPPYAIAPPRPSGPPEGLVPQSRDWAVVRASLGAPQARSTEEFIAGDITVPDFQGKLLRQVTEQTSKLSLKLRSSGSGKAVAQYPYAGARVSARTPVEVRFSNAP
jgi:hypothetical protein